MYQSLKDKGLKLSEEDFSTILDAVTQGAEDVKRYLGTTNDPWPKFLFSDSIDALGFSSLEDAINIHLTYLNHISENETPLKFRDQLACFVPDKFYVIFKYLYWLRLFGREETIHYYQKRGNPLLHAPFPNAFPKTLSAKTFLLSDVEVEARKTVDKVASLNNENIVWKPIDDYLSTNFSEYYNKPIEYLATQPKPNISISFEIENILT